MNTPPDTEQSLTPTALSTDDEPASGARFGARTALHVLVAVTAATLAISFGDFEFEHVRRKGAVLSGIRVDHVDLSGCGRKKAIDRMRALERELKKRRVNVTIGSRRFDLDPNAIGLQIDLERTVDAALIEGRSGSPLHRFASFLGRLIYPKVVSPVADFDRKVLERLIGTWEKAAVSDLPMEGRVHFEKEDLIVEYPRRGRGVDRDQAVRVIAPLLARTSSSSVALPLTARAPQLSRLDVDRAADRARALVHERVILETDAPGLSVQFEPDELRAFIMSRAELEADPHLAVLFDPAKVQRKLSNLPSALDRPASDARFVVDAQDRVTIEPSQTELRADPVRVANALEQAASTRQRVASLPLVPGEAPTLTTDAALALHIKGLVSSFTTRHVCCQPRVANIHHIADLLDNTLIKPGDVFSVNQRIGARTTANGFVSAPSIEDGEMVDTIGGGISQFATTFFNAVFYGGYDIIERQAHTYYFDRYPVGHEATLSYPKPDLIFRNDTDAGLLIKTSYTDTSITVKLYGDNGGRKIDARVSNRMDLVRPEVELIPNRKLAADEEKVKESGSYGWSVIVARIITFADGTHREERRKVTYNPRVRRVEVHPCRIPDGEKGYTGEPCPEKEESAEASENPPERIR